MKTLLIMRHAKSSWKEEDQPDHERPLNDRGRRDAPRMGHFLKKQGYRADVILTSSAKRAHKTAKAVAEAMNCKGPLNVVDALYLAAPSVYLEVLQQLPAEVRTVLIVGHNPAISEWATRLTRQHVELPTAAVACVTLPVDAWEPLEEDLQGTLRGLWVPRKLDD